MPIVVESTGSIETVALAPLKRADMAEIVDIQRGRLARLLADRKIAVALDPEAREWLAEKGYDPAYGARPLKRVVQKALQDPLARMLLAGEKGWRDDPGYRRRGGAHHRQSGGGTDRKSAEGRAAELMPCERGGIGDILTRSVILLFAEMP